MLPVGTWPAVVLLCTCREPITDYAGGNRFQCIRQEILVCRPPPVMSLMQDPNCAIYDEATNKLVETMSCQRALP